MNLTLKELTELIYKTVERERERPTDPINDDFLDNTPGKGYNHTPGKGYKSGFLEGLTYALYVIEGAEHKATRMESIKERATREGTFQGILDAKPDPGIAKILERCGCDFNVEVAEKCREKKTVTITISGEVSDIEFNIEMG